MSHHITPAAEQANMGSLLPSHVPPQPQRAYTLPPTFNSYCLHNQPIASNSDTVVVAQNEKKTWLAYVKEYATVIGVALTLIGVIVAIITVFVK